MCQNTLYVADTECARIHFFPQKQGVPKHYLSQIQGFAKIHCIPQIQGVPKYIISRRYRVLPKYIIFRKYRVCQKTLYPSDTGCGKIHYIPQIQGVPEYIISQIYKVYQNTFYPVDTGFNRMIMNRRYMGYCRYTVQVVPEYIFLGKSLISCISNDLYCLAFLIS